MEEKSVLIR